MVEVLLHPSQLLGPASRRTLLMCRDSMVASLGNLGSSQPQAPIWCELLCTREEDMGKSG